MLASVTLGDDGGLETFDIRHFIKEVLGEGEEKPQIDGFMIYGTDVIEKPQAFQDMKDFFALTADENKIRGFHGTGNPGKIFDIRFNDCLI